MKFCFITSEPHLEDFAIESSYHLVLSHLLKDNNFVDYRKFYRQRIKLGQYVILDNSFYELGHSIDEDLLIWQIKTYKPQEIISPELKIVENKKDIIDFSNTISRFVEKLKETYKEPIKIQAVVKGTTVPTYLECYEMLSNHKYVDVIGIPVNMSKVIRRDSFFEILIKKNMLSTKQHHLNGLEFPEELSTLNKIVRSCDSSLPFWMGVHGIPIYSFGLLYKKVKIPVDFKYHLKYKQQYDIIYNNIRTIKKLIGEIK